MKSRSLLQSAGRIRRTQPIVTNAVTARWRPPLLIGSVAYHLGLLNAKLPGEPSPAVTPRTAGGPRTKREVSLGRSSIAEAASTSRSAASLLCGARHSGLQASARLRQTYTMPLDAAQKVWDRASRMLRDLATHVESTDEHAFGDRLPYVLDLLAGVRRQIDEGLKPIPPALAVWWNEQRTPRREAITSMRNAELKRYERQAKRTSITHTNSSAGTLRTSYSDGRPEREQSINAGDTVVIATGWKFVGGHFDGQEVLRVLTDEHADLGKLIREAETRSEPSLS